MKKLVHLFLGAFVASSPLLAQDPVVQFTFENEASEASEFLEVPLRLSFGVQRETSFRLEVLSIDADLEVDFLAPLEEFVTFVPGQTSQTIRVPIIADDVAEGDEEFFLIIRDLVGLSNATTSTISGRIINDDFGNLPLTSGRFPRPRFSNANVTFDGTNLNGTYEQSLVLNPSTSLSSSVPLVIDRTDEGSLSSLTLLGDFSTPSFRVGTEESTRASLSFGQDVTNTASERTPIYLGPSGEIRFDTALSDFAALQAELTRLNLDLYFPDEDGFRLINNDENYFLLRATREILTDSEFPTRISTVIRRVKDDFEFIAESDNENAPEFLRGGFSFDYTSDDRESDDPNIAIYERSISAYFSSSEMSGKVIPDSRSGPFDSSFFNPETTIVNDAPAENPFGLPAGSDFIQLRGVWSNLASRSTDRYEFILRFTDPSGEALSDDSLPRNLSLADFEITQINFDGSQERRFPNSYSLRTSVVEGYLTVLFPDREEPSALPNLTATASPTNEGLIGYPVTFTLSSPAQGGELFSFALASDEANLFEDFQPYSDIHVFAAGESSLTILFTLTDDATIEPDETFNLVLSNPQGIAFERTIIPLTILNDDTLLDDFGANFGLNVAERMADSDGDGDGHAIAVEFAFNLDPTIAESPSYQPGQDYRENEEPSGLPVLVHEDGTLKYLFPRRSDAAPRVSYLAEISNDGINFVPIAESQVTALVDNWEEVEILLRDHETSDSEKAFIRVRIVNNE